MSEGTSPAPAVTLPRIFWEFLIVGATSFGGGVVAYLRNSLVGRNRWIDDRTFVELLSIGQTLPGLNATNLAVLVGDRLRGAAGAVAALVAICLPGALLMFAAGAAYGMHGSRPMVTAVLHGVAAAATGLVFALTVQLGRKSLSETVDIAFVLVTAVAVHYLHIPVPWVLLVVGAIAIWWHRPRPAAEAAPGE